MDEPRDPAMAGEPGAKVHFWTQSCFAAFAVGLLDPGDERAVWEHLRACVTCRSAFEEFVARGEDEAGDAGDANAVAAAAARADDGHVPPALLWRLERERARLDPLERELIERHLARCETCRGAIEFARGWSKPGTKGTRPPGRRSFARVGAIGAAAAAAAAAVVTIFLLQPDRRDRAPSVVPRPGPGPESGTTTAPSPSTVSGPGGTAPGAATPPAPGAAPPPAPGMPAPGAPTADRIAGPFVLDAPLRSGEDSGNRFTVSSDARGIELLPAPLEGWPRSARLRVEVRGPAGNSLLDREIENGDLFADSGPIPIVVRPKAGALARGRYLLRLTTLETSALTGEPDVAEYLFDVSTR